MDPEKTIFEDFARFFESPSRKSLRRLLRTHMGETDQLDFKADWPSLEKMAKHVIAIGNSGGGAVVLGVKENGSDLVPEGISDTKDKADIGNTLNKYIPAELKYHVLDFPFQESEYSKLKGLIFQVIVIESNPLEVPYIPERSSEEIEENRIYVRRSTSTAEANRQDLKTIVRTRVNAEISSEAKKLGDELDQLQTLYNYRASSANPLIGGSIFGGTGFKSFVEKLIEEKQSLIRDEIGLPLRAT